MSIDSDGAPLADTSSLPARGKPLVSVVVAAFNAGDFVLEAIDSARAQSYPNLEIIVVDDGSTDGTVATLRQLGDEINLVCRPVNAGPAVARNAALEIASGKYVAVLDADDVWHPDRLTTIIDYMEAHPEASIVTSDVFLLVGGIRTDRSWFGTPETAFREKEQFMHIFRSNFLGSHLVIRRELFDRHGLYDESLSVGEDWDRNIAFLQKGALAVKLPDVLSYYRVTLNSLSSDAVRMDLFRKKILEKWLKQPLMPKARKSAKSSLKRVEWDLIKLRLLPKPDQHIRSELIRIFVGAPIDVKLKVLSWIVLPSARVSRVHLWRARLVTESGGPWALRQAAQALEAGQSHLARRHLTAVALLGFPLKMRFVAVAWVMFPFARARLASKIIAAGGDSDPSAH